MMQFHEESVSEAVDRSIRDADHLQDRDAAAVAALRALARKIDGWDAVVRMAQASDSATKVPAHDNVSLGTFLKYLEQLQLVPPRVEGKPASGGAATSLDAWRQSRGKTAAS